jgi:uncharacterized protein
MAQTPFESLPASSLPLRALIEAILAEYALPINGDHGISHWARVLENGCRLSEVTGARIEVVRLFAIFHDSCRHNEGHDPQHGWRGARLAERFRGTLFDLPDHDFALLVRACEGHTHERTHPDVTIQTCWDADRLDLERVGITPHPKRLCTEYARTPAILDWAIQRGIQRTIPKFVVQEWGIDLD